MSGIIEKRIDRVRAAENFIERRLMAIASFHSRGLWVYILRAHWHHLFLFRYFSLAFRRQPHHAIRCLLPPHQRTVRKLPAILLFSDECWQFLDIHHTTMRYKMRQSSWRSRYLFLAFTRHATGFRHVFWSTMSPPRHDTFKSTAHLHQRYFRTLFSREYRKSISIYLVKE